MTEKPPVRQQSSENNSLSSSEWDMANDVFVSGYDDNPLGDIAAAGDLAQPGLDRHLPLLPQDGMMLGLAGEEYTASSYLDIEPNYTESDGNITTKKRIRSNSSRHRGDIVTELGPEEVRWFYKEDKRTWKPFVGHDSLKIEVVYRKFCELNPDKIRPPADLEEAEVRDATSPDEAQPDRAVGDSGSVRAEPPVTVQRGGGQQQRSAAEDTKDLDDISISVEAVCVRGGLYEVDIREKECYPVYWNREHWFIFSIIIIIITTLLAPPANTAAEHQNTRTRPGPEVADLRRTVVAVADLFYFINSLNICINMLYAHRSMWFRPSSM